MSEHRPSDISHTARAAIAVALLLCCACWQAVELLYYSARVVNESLGSPELDADRRRPHDLVFLEQVSWYRWYAPALAQRFMPLCLAAHRFEEVGFTTADIEQGLNTPRDAAHQFIAAYVLAPTVMARGRSFGSRVYDVLVADFDTEAQLAGFLASGEWDVLAQGGQGLALVRRKAEP